MIKNDADRLIGVWPHKASEGYEIKYQLKGKKTSEYRKSKVAADQRGAYWKHVLEGGPQPMSSGETEEFTHPVIYWERKLRQAADHLLANPSDEQALDVGKVIAQIATAGLRAANYYPPPTAELNAQGAPIVEGDVKNLTTEELNKLIESKEK